MIDIDGAGLAEVLRIGLVIASAIIGQNDVLHAIDIGALIAAAPIKNAGMVAQPEHCVSQVGEDAFLEGRIIRFVRRNRSLAGGKPCLDPYHNTVSVAGVKKLIAFRSASAPNAQPSKSRLRDHADLRIVTLGTLAQQSILHPSPTGHEQSFAVYFPCALTVKISLMLDGTNSEMRYCRV